MICVAFVFLHKLKNMLLLDYSRLGRIDRMTIIDKRDRLIKQWLKEAAAEIKQSLTLDLKVKTKTSYNDLVTHMDQQIEKKLVEQIKSHFPDDKIVSEEGYGDEFSAINPAEDTVWYLDPIDGTLNFVLQKERFAIMIAVYEKGIGKQAYILDVMTDKLYWSIKNQGVYRNNQLLPKINNIPLSEGLFASNSMFISDEQVRLNTEITKLAMGVRTIGSAGMEIIELLEGNTVVYLSYGLKAWDLAAGYMMIQENGGCVKRLDDSKVDFYEPRPTLMGTDLAITEIRKIL